MRWFLCKWLELWPRVVVVEDCTQEGEVEVK
jgi:hypothetical protein